MRGRNLWIVIISLLLLLVLGLGLGIGLTRSGDNTMEGMIREVPQVATSSAYWNTKAMADDSDLHKLLDKWKSDNETWLEGFAISSDKVEYFLQFSMNPDILIVKGDFNLNELRTELQNRGYYDKDYKHVETWESADGQDRLAIMDDSLVGGNKDGVIEVINVFKGDSSLYDDQDIKEVLDKLPGGILVYLDNYANGAPYNGLVASGESFEKKDKDTLKVNLVYKFHEPVNATNAINDIAEKVDEYFDNVDAEQDGRFVIVTAEINIEYFIKHLLG